MYLTYNMHLSETKELLVSELTLLEELGAGQFGVSVGSFYISNVF